MLSKITFVLVTSVIFAQLRLAPKPIQMSNGDSGNGEVVSVRLTVEAKGNPNAQQSNQHHTKASKTSNSSYGDCRNCICWVQRLYVVRRGPTRQTASGKNERCSRRESRRNSNDQPNRKVAKGFDGNSICQREHGRIASVVIFTDASSSIGNSVFYGNGYFAVIPIDFPLFVATNDHLRTQRHQIDIGILEFGSASPYARHVREKSDRKAGHEF